MFVIDVLLFQLCLLSKCLKPALPFLEVDITEISKEVGKVLWQRIMVGRMS